MGIKHKVMRPLVTIITVTLNANNTIIRCIESVVNQSYDKIEHIIIDGGSNDGTLENIKKYDQIISRYISERDDGIFYAMNKGFDLANGEIIAFLNADDYYETDAVKRSVDFILKRNLDYSYSKLKIDKNEMPSVIINPKCNNLDDALKLQEMPFPHPTLFIRKNVLLKLGRFDTQYRYSSDYDFALRMLKENFRGEKVDEVLANYQIGGASSSQEAINECLRIAIRHGKNPLLAGKVFAFKSIRRQIGFMVPRKLKTFLLNNYL